MTSFDATKKIVRMRAVEHPEDGLMTLVTWACGHEKQFFRDYIRDIFKEGDNSACPLCWEQVNLPTK
jgi:hypothetical protein